jgi:hypothetical protein
LCTAVIRAISIVHIVLFPQILGAVEQVVVCTGTRNENKSLLLYFFLCFIQDRTKVSGDAYVDGPMLLADIYHYCGSSSSSSAGSYEEDYNSELLRGLRIHEQQPPLKYRGIKGDDYAR